MSRAHAVALAALLLAAACGDEEPASTPVEIGTKWTRADAGTLNDLTSVAFGGSFVAVGKGGTILISDDGLTWEAVASNTSHDLRSIVYAASRYVAVGDHGTVLTSPTGAFWTTVDLGLDVDLTSVTRTGSSYYAAGWGTLLESSDGARWTTRTKSAGGERIATISGMVTLFGGSEISTSFAGGTWTPHALPDPTFRPAQVLSLGQSPQERVFAIGARGTEGWVSYAPLSYSGEWTWAGGRVSPAPLRALAVRNGMHVVVGEQGVVLSTRLPTGTWSLRSPGVARNLNAVAAGDVGFVAVGDAGTIIVSQ